MRFVLFLVAALALPGTAHAAYAPLDRPGPALEVSAAAAHTEPSLPMKRIVLDEIEIIGNRANPNTAQETIDLLVNNRVDLKPLMTHRFPLKEFGTALDIFEERKDGAIKVATKPNGMNSH